LPERFGDTDQDTYALLALGQGGVWREAFEMLASDADNEYAMTRQHDRASASARARRTKKDSEDQASGAAKAAEHQIQRSSMRLGNPLDFILTPGKP